MPPCRQQQQLKEAKEGALQAIESLHVSCLPRASSELCVSCGAVPPPRSCAHPGCLQAFVSGLAAEVDAVLHDTYHSLVMEQLLLKARSSQG